ncbi:MAG: hypothetical protein ACRD2N_01165, partial [Vicinamibacterales bacterium]
MLSTAFRGVDGKFIKAMPFGLSWVCHFAGDTSVALPLLSSIRHELEADGYSLFDVIPVESMSVCLQRGFRAFRMARAVDTVLSGLGLSVADFLAQGRAMFGENHFATMRDKLDQYDLGVV